MIRLVAIATVAVLALSGCAGTQFGAAAVVGDETIEMSTVEASVTGLLNQRRNIGEQDSGTVRNGQSAREQVRFFILTTAMAQVAKARGITISEGEKTSLRRDFLARYGTPDALLLAMTQNGIAEADFDRYIEVVLYQRKLGELLVPGDEQEVAAQRGEAVNNAVLEHMSKIEIKVNPRFGIFDPLNVTISERDDTNGVVTLPVV